MGRVERGVANPSGLARALVQARAAYAELDQSDQAGCAASLDKLAA